MNSNPPKNQVRKGICLGALLLAASIACLVIDHKYDCPYLQNLSVLLTPIGGAYIGSTYFGNTMPKKWKRKHWLITALLFALLAIGVTWLGKNP